MWKIVIAAVLAVVLVVVVAVMLIMRGLDLSQYEHLKEPKISTKPDQKVIVVEAKGEPNAVAGKAFKLLFNTYFRLKGLPKGRPPAPRARWLELLDKPKTEWVGLYAMPVPDTIESLPEQKATEAGLSVKLATWEYGEVAEILHVGRYDREEPTIEKLKKFIADSGYEIAGAHEEEYIKGPGMFFAGNPEKYYTIIRYRVKKAQ
ncbi:MAG: hypothetical protein JSU70_17695 [Phycisphaerales bacterium]|nr:MAG: hypothetical protein JSU70_17695 [Phycisphaerales bacterium]